MPQRSNLKTPRSFTTPLAVLLMLAGSLGCLGSTPPSANADDDGNTGNETSAAYADPTAEAMNQTAPDTFDAVFSVQTGNDASTRQTFTVRTVRDWAPLGADRFYNLVDSGYFNDQRVFRVVPKFVAQFGIHGDPAIADDWRAARIADDPIRPDVSNTTGRVVFANAGPNTRTTQLFINLADNAFLDDPVRMRGSVFAPFGEVIDGMAAVRAINAEYGEAPNQGLIQTRGNDYLDARFPELTRIVSAEIVEPAPAESETQADTEAGPR